MLRADRVKDRRPITPPPCIRLIIMDPDTKQEVDVKYVSRGPRLAHLLTPLSTIDSSLFVLTVDLWSAEGDREVNLVKHAQTSSPAISSVSPGTYPHTESNEPRGQAMPQPYHWANFPHYSNQTFSSPISTVSPSSAVAYYSNEGRFANINGASQSYPTQTPYTLQNPRNSYTPYYPQPHPSPQPSNQSTPSMSPYMHHPSISSTSGPSGMFTRNLIGSLSASAFKLHDTSDHLGIWFVLQDLSVRTEGWFRLKMNFVNVGKASDPNTPGANGEARQQITRDTAPVLASIWSKPFQVFSAKKFPGVIESTDLSRCFANQGIKIPIRKDQPNQSAKRKHSVSQDQDDDQDDED